jgi:hypothetical protein
MRQISKIFSAADFVIADRDIVIRPARKVGARDPDGWPGCGTDTSRL